MKKLTPDEEMRTMEEITDLVFQYGKKILGRHGSGVDFVDWFRGTRPDLYIKIDRK